MKKEKLKLIVFIIIILSIVVRIIYVVKTPYMKKQHDIEPSGNGLDYINKIYETGRLPQDNIGQHYHPPLFQIVSAGWMKVMNIFTDNKETMYESLQFLTLIFSVILILIVCNILKELKINDKLKILVLLVMAFHPTLIILSGSINNDNLSFVLMMWSILWLIKWYKKSSVKNVIILAILTGLSVMTKSSGASIAIPILYVFILKLYKELKKTKHKRPIIEHYISMFIIFGMISLPIGLWYQVRNYLLFNQPIFLVKDPKNARLWVGDYSLWDRFCPFSKELLALYCNPWDDYNIPAYVIKCSLFGEFEWGKNLIFQILYFTSIYVNVILIMITLVFMIKVVLNRNKRYKVWKNALFLWFLFNILSFISVNIKLPYGCTMDFRYLLPTLFAGAMFVCFGLKDIKKDRSLMYNEYYKIITVLSLIVFISSDIIILCS